MNIHALLLLLLWVAVVAGRSEPRPIGWRDGTDCTSEAPTDRWRKDCNWCSCRDGRGACTRRGCRGGESRETAGSPCEGNPTWKVDCNTCHCVEGRAVCTENLCDQSSQQLVQTVSKVIHTTKAECDNGSRWRVDCNWCTCEDGISHCTEALCVGWNEQKAQEEGIVQCHGSSHWKKDCNWCTCKNGRGMCTKRACIPTERDPFHNLPKSATCVPGSRWLNDCNWCSCGNTGNALCTLMACPEGSTHEGSDCEEGSIWRNDDCNLCRCIDGRSACTKRLCRTPPQVVQEPQVLQEPEEPEELQEPQCQGDASTDRWRMDCNWCSCRNGVGTCTRRVCPEGVKDKEQECEGNPSWMKDCNRCSCINGKAVCTMRLCGGPPPPPRAKEPECQSKNETDRWTQDCNWCSCRNGVPGCTKRLCREGVEDLGRCEGNPSWKKDCNRCHCDNGTALCTTKYCGTPSPPQNRRAQIAMVKNKNPVCEAGAHWRVGCNWCSCSNGMAICTLKACLDQNAVSDEPECKGYASWKDDCNWCTCGDGYALCTRMACLKKSDEPCTEGRSWRNSCNTCRCSHGFVLCTKRACRERGEQIECQGDSCGPRELPELCKLAPVEGLLQCAAFIEKWTFSTSDGMCRQIVYGGCGGTENLFDSEEECKATCHTTTTTQNRRTDAPSKTQGSERCYLPQDQGPCFGAMPRFAYNAESGLCEDFLFGGCAGNGNNFKTREECLATCKPRKALGTCDKSKCAWELWEHYLVKQCVPQYAGDACCPTSFKCASASEAGKDLTKCYYKGVSYKVGDSVPVENPCSAQCRCLAAHDPSSPSEITCANVECPELFRRGKPGCRNLYRADSCCAYDQECVDPDGPSLEPRSATCTWQNNTYPVGAVMTVDDYPCQRCICEAGFTDPTGPGCSKIDCGFEFRYTSQLHQGCSPIHFETGRCCPIGWMCPDDSKIIPQQQQQQQSGSSDESSVCHLGENRLGVGEALTLTDCKIECRCLTPPELTCIQYRSCEVAREAAAQRACPVLTCGIGCHPVVGSLRQCPTCSCSHDTFSCPAQTCPSSCISVVDLETGCPTCKCKCTKELKCPLGCPSHTVLDQDTGCPRCECKPGSTQILDPEVCHVYLGGVVPCPQDCAIIKTVDENGCEVCKCDPNDPGNPFMHPLPPMFAQKTVCAYSQGEAPCPMDCAIIRTMDENGCEVCGCDPNNPGNPFGPPPPPVHLRGTACAYPRGEAPCPMDCAIIRSMDENGCEVCGCDPNNPGNPFGPPPPTQIRVRRSCPGKWEAPCPLDCGVIRYKDDNDCWRCKCDPNDSGSPFIRPLPIIFPQETACAYPRGEAPCPLDCAIIRVNDENDCEVCKCDPNNPGNPFGPPPPST